MKPNRNIFELKFEELNVVSDGGYEQGYSQGHIEGFSKGEVEGYSKGRSEGIETGYSLGFEGAKKKLEEITITENGEYTPTSESIGFNKVNVNVVLENKLAALASNATFELSEEDLAVVGEIRQYAFYYSEGLVSVEIPTTVTSIGYNAFAYCKNLVSVTIPQSVTKIKSQAFIGCSSLKSITIPNGVSSINTQTFESCSGLRNVVIGESVKNIYGFTFSRCTAIQTFQLLCTTPPSLNNRAFYESTIRKIIVPQDTIEAYKSATNWSAYADVMEEVAE